MMMMMMYQQWSTKTVPTVYQQCTNRQKQSKDSKNNKNDHWCTNSSQVNQHCTNSVTIVYQSSTRTQLSQTDRVQSAHTIRRGYSQASTLHRDLEIYIKGQSRSLETEPSLDRSYTTYYQSSYLTLNIIVTLKCGLEVTQDH